MVDGRVIVGHLASSTCSRYRRTGSAYGTFVAQLKIMQEVITLVVFVPFSVVYMGQPVKLTSCGRLASVGVVNSLRS